MPLRRVAVLGGSDAFALAAYLEAATELGRVLAEQGLTLVHAGAAQGPARALLAAFASEGGTAAPAPDLPRAVAAADAAVVLPGGTGTLAQWLAAGLEPARDQPCGLLNTGDYFNALLKDEADAVVERFVQESQRGRLIVEREPEALLRALAEFRPPESRRQGP